MSSYGMSPYGIPLNRTMFFPNQMSPQMAEMLEYRNQLRARRFMGPDVIPFNPMEAEEEEQTEAPPLKNRERLEQLQNEVGEMSRGLQMISAQQGRLAQHLGAGAGMMGGLGSLLGNRLMQTGLQSGLSRFLGNPFMSQDPTQIRQAQQQAVEDA